MEIANNQDLLAILESDVQKKRMRENIENAMTLSGWGRKQQLNKKPGKSQDKGRNGESTTSHAAFKCHEYKKVGHMARIFRKNEKLNRGRRETWKKSVILQSLRNKQKNTR